MHLFVMLLLSCTTNNCFHIIGLAGFVFYSLFFFES